MANEIRTTKKYALLDLTVYEIEQGKHAKRMYVNVCKDNIRV